MTERARFGPDNVVELLRQLIAIDSSNPDLVTDGSGESEIAEYVAHWLHDRGFDVHRLEDRPGRPSIVAVASGRGGGSSMMLNGHIDTVSLAGYDKDAALDPVIRDGKMYGRGSYDMKSGIAAMMVAAAGVAVARPRGDVILALVADEEYASTGTEEVLRCFSADGAIVVEPSGLDIVIAHRGFVWFDVTIHGVAAHGSRPDLGLDSIVKAGAFLTEVGKLNERILSGEPHPLLATGNLHASLISGGEELSSFPACCVVSLERRTIPGEEGATVEAELRTVLDNIASLDPGFHYELTRSFERSTFAADVDSRVVNILARAYERDQGKAAVQRGEPFWTDCALLQDAGIPTVLFGVDGGGAHAATEWVTIDSLNTVCRVLERTLSEFTA